MSSFKGLSFKWALLVEKLGVMGVVIKTNMTDSRSNYKIQKERGRTGHKRFKGSRFFFFCFK